MRSKQEEIKRLLNYITDKEALERLRKELKQFKYLTPWVVKERYEVKMGDAKRMLKILELEGHLEVVHHDNRNPIYKPKK